MFGAPLVVGRSSGEKSAGGDDTAGALRDVSDEELKEAHGAYVAALTRLFEDNKARFGYANRELLIL